MSSVSTDSTEKITLDLTNLKQLVKILFPVVLLLGVVSVTGFIERVLLAEYSKEALAGSLNGFFLARVFQAACLSVIIIGQAFVGLYFGAGKPLSIGSCVWQMIWFSLISIVFVVPLGFLAERLLFSDTIIAVSGSRYFAWLCLFNFLYPLGSALSSFYLGRGITWPIFWMTIGTSLLNILLDVLLIFGFASVPPMGAEGAAIGRVTSQGVLCIVLFILFLSPKNRMSFGTQLWRFSPRLFWHYVRPGIVRALGAFPSIGDWVFVSRYMSLKSELHLLVYSIGSSIFFLLTFVGDGLFRTMVTVVSNHIGKKEFRQIWVSFYSALAVVVVMATLFAIPFFLYPDLLIQIFRSSAFNDQFGHVFSQIGLSLWIMLIAYTLNTLVLSLIVTSRDTLFLLGYYCLQWVISFVPVYVTMNILGWGSDKFWLVTSFSNLIGCSIFLVRAIKERWRRDDWQPYSPPLEIDSPMPSSM